MTASDQSPIQQVEAAREAFEREFERFVRFTGDDVAARDLSLKDAEAEQRALAELRAKHTGKKSALAACKKLIGRVEPDERAAFGQLVQRTDAGINQSIEDADQRLKSIIESARTERDSIDVTIPGRRPRPGHLHPITLMRQRI